MLSEIHDWLAPHYLTLKFIHLFFVMLWGFSAIGGFWYLIVANREYAKNRNDEEMRRRKEWAQWHFNNVVVLEHIAFPLVILTGVTLFWVSDWPLDGNWLFWKLVVVLGIFIPMEVMDTWLSHWHSPRAMREREANPQGYRAATRLHNRFLDISSWVVLFLVPGVIYLAVVKPF